MIGWGVSPSRNRRVSAEETEDTIGFDPSFQWTCGLDSSCGLNGHVVSMNYSETGKNMEQSTCGLERQMRISQSIAGIWRSVPSDEGDLLNV